MVFGEIESELTKSGKSLSLFKKDVKDITHDLTHVHGIQGISTLFSKGINKTDIENLKQYNEAISAGMNKQTAFYKYLNNSSSAAQNLAMNAKYGTVAENEMSAATQKLTISQKAATLSTKALSIGLNLLTNIGISMAINAVISSITKLINKEKEAAEKAAQLKQEQETRRKAAIESIKTSNEEIEAIHDLTEQYVKLVSSTNDITTIKGDLSSLQDEIIDKYGKEADGIDIVNGKLSENLDLMMELEKKENEKWLRDNNQNIHEAEEYFKNQDSLLLSFVAKKSDFMLEDGTWFNNGQNDYNEAKQEAKSYFNYLKRLLEESGMSDYIKFVEEPEQLGANIRDYDKTYRYAFELVDGLTPEQQTEAINAIKSAYDEMLNSNIAFDDYFNLWGNRLDQLNERVEITSDNFTTLSEAVKRTAEIDAFGFFDTDEGKKIKSDYEELIDQAQTLSQKLNDPNASGAAMFDYSYQLEETKQQLRNLIDEYPVLENQAELTFKNMGLSIDEVVTNEEEIFNKFFDKLEDTHKTAFSNIEKFEDAMAKSIAGETLTSTEAWDILEFNKDRDILPFLDKDTNTYTMKYEELVITKDKYIKQMKTEIELEKEAAVQNKKNVDSRLESAKGELQQIMDNSNRPYIKQDHDRMQELESQIKSLTTSSKAYGREIAYNDLLIQSYDSHMGNLASTSRMLQARIDGLKKSQEKLKEDVENLNNTADNLLKAQEYKLDQIISKHEDEKEILDDELDSLNEQLDVLEKQKDELDEIIDNYKQVADVVSDAVDKEKELLEEQRKSQEDAYNERINALKEAHEQQEEENELTEKQIALQEKLQALENAKQNKVMTYSSERGWHYDVDKEELLAAQKEADNAQKDIDDTLAERAYEAEIKALEDERDSILENYDLQIEAYENYVKEWKEILEEQTNAENERLAQEVLGSDWREKIKEKDAFILNNYKSEFRNYNSQLSSLVNGEMANLKKSIEAKNEEIKAKQELIDQWKNYKSEVQKAVNDIKNANEDYMQYLDGIVLDENSSLEEREANLANFTANYKSYMDEIIAKNNELEATTNQINEFANATERLGEMQSNVNEYANHVGESVKNALSSFAELFSSNDDSGYQGGQMAALIRKLRGYSEGGIADYTGLAMLHGTKSRPELVLNNTDAAKLYDMIHDSSFVDMMMEKQYGHLIKSIPANHNSTNNTNTSINIDHMEIRTPDPLSFHDQFQKELKQHYRFALSESKVR